MKILKTFVSAILAGLCIGFGGIAFLSIENKVIGALFFTVGLFCVCNFKLHLFTGKVCYTFENNLTYALELPVIWLGNLAGTGIAAIAVNASRINGISARAAALCETTALSVFLFSEFYAIFLYT